MSIDASGYARQINPALKVFQVSVLKGDGMDEWYSFLRERKAAVVELER